VDPRFRIKEDGKFFSLLKPSLYSQNRNKPEESKSARLDAFVKHTFVFVKLKFA
jgi:hypothetical protein